MAKDSILIQARKRQAKIAGDFSKLFKDRIPTKDDCAEMHPEVELNKAFSCCARTALLRAIVNSETLKMNLQLRCCTTGEAGLWIGLPAQQYSDFLDAVAACGTSQSGGGGPLSLTIINPPK